MPGGIPYDGRYLVQKLRDADARLGRIQTDDAVLRLRFYEPGRGQLLDLAGHGHVTRYRPVDVGAGAALLRAYDAEHLHRASGFQNLQRVAGPANATHVIVIEWLVWPRFCYSG